MLFELLKYLWILIFIYTELRKIIEIIQLWEKLFDLFRKIINFINFPAYFSLFHTLYCFFGPTKTIILPSGEDKRLIQRNFLDEEKG